VAVVAAVIAATVAVLYVWLMDRQGDEPVAWFLGGLISAAVLAAYGAASTLPGRRMALGLASGLMLALGFLGMASIGLPVLGAGVLTLISVARQPDRVRAAGGRRPRSPRPPRPPRPAPGSPGGTRSVSRRRG
jgi:hypothetical protein